MMLDECTRSLISTVTDYFELSRAVACRLEASEQIGWTQSDWSTILVPDSTASHRDTHDAGKI